jgi:two-component system nitrate/nitrite response regulator NarL
MGLEQRKVHSKDSRVKILLVDDHVLLRQGLSRWLQSHDNLEVVGEASDGSEGIRKAKELQPDIVLMDISMPGMCGLEATKILLDAVPSAKVLALTMHEEKEFVLQMIQSGAHGYVLKSAPPSDFLKAVETVFNGGSFFSEGISQMLLNDYVQQAGRIGRAQRTVLSEREREVLALIAQGCSNKEIAARLRVGVRTVETHREHIIQKLDIHTTAGLTRYAIAKGIVVVD